MAAFHFLSNEKNGIPMIFFCDVLAYTTYNHTSFLHVKRLYGEKMYRWNIKKKVGQTEMEKYYKATSSRKTINQ